MRERHNKILYRSFINFPPGREPDGNVDSRINGTLLRIKSHGHLDNVVRLNIIDFINQANQNKFSLLEHQLSPAWEARQPPKKVRFENTKIEMSMLQCAIDLLRPILDNGTTKLRFAETLCLLNAGLNETARSTLRKSEVYITSDLAGVRIMLPCAKEVEHHIMLLENFVLESGDVNGILRATTMLVIILNIHPFMDGNGRLSRLIFNALIAIIYGENIGYIPLYDFFNRSRGGFQIRLRQVEIQGNWLPLMEYIFTIFDIFEEFVAMSTAATVTRVNHRESM